MKQITGILIVLILAFQAAGQEKQRGNTYIAPWDVPALEDPYFFEPYFDTVYIHDTVYVSNADAFLKKYYKGNNINLNELVKNQQILDSILCHLSSVSGKELFYNYFGHNRFPKALSNSIAVKDFSLGKNLRFKRNPFYSGTPPAGAVSNELLFRFEGTYRTNRFLNDPEAILRAISYIFETIQADTCKIKSINLYFPDFDFREKRAMAQFVKSVRMVLDAAKEYDIKTTKLKIFFHGTDEERIGEGFLYSLMIKASEVVLLDPTNVIDDYYVEGNPFSKSEMDSVDLFTRMSSHFYLARFTNGNPEIKDTLMNFSVNSIRDIAQGDLPENNWESYLWFLIGLLVLVITIATLYFLYPPFSYILNQNMGIVLASSIVFSIEIFMLAGVVFQNMCTEDESTSLSENPSFLFFMPILMVVVLPMVRQFTRSKKLP